MMRLKVAIKTIIAAGEFIEIVARIDLNQGEA
jgi:hypothetical protein